LKRAKLQTTGTIFNKQTQLLAYADDIDIVARSLEAATIGLNINKKKDKIPVCGRFLQIGRFSTPNKLWLLA
jgi:hypothetical protein